ncbi:MAG: hypothetical protein OEN22_01305, partial [Gammaproteobacteria bacterium]|nr:hypothetical protein [Gammaproteobacteria bacterium]
NPPNSAVPISRDSKFALLQQSCSTCVWAVHNPLYQAPDLSNSAAMESTIIVRATTSATGFQAITLEVTTSQIVECPAFAPDLAPIAFPCGQNAMLVSIDCLGDKTGANIECEYDLEIDNQTLVSYRAIATAVDATTMSSPLITYSYGEPGNGKAKPIWWHTGEADSLGYLDRIRIGYFPDPEYDPNNPLSGNKTYSAFADHVNEIVGRAFFNDDENFAAEYTANRHFFDLWAAPFGGKAPDICVNAYIYNINAKPARQLVSAGVIVHERYYADCSHIEFPPGDGTVYSGSSENGWLMVHESGHFLAGLSDEYDRNKHLSCSQPNNVHESEFDCHGVASLALVNAPTGACTQFPTSKMWRIDEKVDGIGLLEIMDKEIGQKKESSFQKSSRRALDILFGNCQYGNCYPVVNTCAGPTPPS